MIQACGFRFYFLLVTVIIFGGMVNLLIFHSKPKAYKNTFCWTLRTIPPRFFEMRP